MTDTKQNNRPNVGENIRYLGEMVEKMMNDTDNIAVPEKTNEPPVIQITGDHNIISTDNGKVVVVKDRSKHLFSWIALAFLFS